MDHYPRLIEPCAHCGATGVPGYYSDAFNNWQCVACAFGGAGGDDEEVTFVNTSPLVGVMLGLSVPSSQGVDSEEMPPPSVSGKGKAAISVDRACVRCGALKGEPCIDRFGRERSYHAVRGTHRLTVDEMVAALDVHDCEPKQRPDGSWMALCPAHDDRNPSLTVRAGADDGAAVPHCFAGCAVAAIFAALR
jgi:hypothetical protein